MALKKIRAAVRKNTPIIFLLFFLETGGLLSHFFNVKLRTRRLYDFLANVYLAFFGSIASIVALIWFALDKVQPTTFVWLFLVPTTFILFFFFCFFCFFFFFFFLFLIYLTRKKKKKKIHNKKKKKNPEKKIKKPEG